MSVLISQVADSFCNLVALNDITTIPVIKRKEEEQDYDFFIGQCEEYVRYFNDLIYRLKQERGDNEQNLDNK